MSLLQRTATGMAIVGDDLVVVRATVRAGALGPRAQVAWEARRFEGALREGADPAGVPAEEWPAPRTLALPLDAMLRREVDAGAQSDAEFREVVRENLTSFLPATDRDALLWDVASTGEPGRRRMFIGAAPTAQVEPALSRLAAMGLAPGRIIPSSLALLAPRLAQREGGAEPVGEIVERTPSGWSAHRFAGLAWAGSRSGAGEAPPGVLGGAAERGAVVIDWLENSAANTATNGATGGETSGAAGADSAAPRGAEAVALGAALVSLWPGIDARVAPPPEFNMLGATPRRGLPVSRFVRWAAVAAVATIGLVGWAEARRDRAAAEVERLQALAKDAKGRVEKVERVRATNNRLVAANDKLAKLESSYFPRARILADLSATVPPDTWVERAEIADEWVYLDVVTASAAPLLQALEESPSFEQARQSTPAVATEVAGESKFRVEAKIASGASLPPPASFPRPPRAPAREAAPAKTPPVAPAAALTPPKTDAPPKGDQATPLAAPEQQPGAGDRPAQKERPSAKPKSDSKRAPNKKRSDP